jgi:hypothetical protein
VEAYDNITGDLLAEHGVSLTGARLHVSIIGTGRTPYGTGITVDLGAHDDLSTVGGTA